jgi:ribulose-5-phosphate 4-epimerase/fuculose-1-phosphate aldolase
LGQIGEPIGVLHNQGAAFAGGVPLFDRIGLIRSRELGDEVAATMGRGRAMLLRGHGANIAEKDVRRAVILACHLEETAELQLAALSAVGGDRSRVRFCDEAECARLADQLDNNGPFDRAWEYYTALVRGEVTAQPNF